MFHTFFNTFSLGDGMGVEHINSWKEEFAHLLKVIFSIPG